MNFLDFNEYVSVKLSPDGEKISIWEYRRNRSNRKLVEYDSLSSFSPNNWTEYEIRYAFNVIKFTFSYFK